MECLQLYNVHHNVEIVYNICTLFVLGEVHSIRNLFVIMSSSDSDFEVGENSCFGDQYEPEYTEE
jgi:hypothetical protein